MAIRFALDRPERTMPRTKSERFSGTEQKPRSFHWKYIENQWRRSTEPILIIYLYAARSNVFPNTNTCNPAYPTTYFFPEATLYNIHRRLRNNRYLFDFVRFEQFFDQNIVVTYNNFLIKILLRHTTQYFGFTSQFEYGFFLLLLFSPVKYVVFIFFKSLHDCKIRSGIKFY